HQDHSMVTAAYAAQNVAGASHDVWDVNVEDDYHEEVARRREPRDATGERLVPVRLDTALSAEVLRRAFARYDAVALGGAVGLLAGVGLFLGTAVLLLVGNEPVGPNLALLGNYLPGFTVTWGGAVLGLIEAGAAGFSVGYLLAQLINAVVRLQERALLRRVERSEALRAPEEST
ncbi:MAG TPA: hypothetical protein VMK65_00365, partial [Longimicrobiales bacterium]|nr:hypothetical protein [Longimicrobiales bacterium]